MKYNILFATVFIILGASSCKKESPNSNIDSDMAASYTQLKVGNYWIYERFHLTDSTTTSTGIIDSCYIEKDTVINSKTYYKMIRPSTTSNTDYSYIRDSLSYLVNNYGAILFSSQNFTDTFSQRFDYYLSSGDTLDKRICKMNDTLYSINTPAGTFSVLENEIIFYMYAGINAYSNRYMTTKYANGVGIVSETLLFYINEPDYTERRLVRYHIN